MASRGKSQFGTSRVFPAPDPNAPPVIPTKIFSSSTIVEKMMLACSGCSTLQDIVSLDLSNRRISTLDPAVFSRMSSLVDLDLTNNKITGFPLSLGLRHLKKLNCNNNQLKSVQTLEQFPNVEELYIENNELTVADQYIAVYMLPKLKILNGKEVDLRETIMNMEETLQEQVHILWAESCAPLLKDPMTKAEIMMLEQQFIELLKTQVQFGPDALKDFTHHMLTVLAEKCVKQMTAHLRKIAEPGTPISKVQIVVRNDSGSTQKSISNGTGTSAQGSKAVDKRQMQEQGQEPANKKSKSVQGAGSKGKVPKMSSKRKMIEAQKKEEGGEEENAEGSMQVVTVNMEDIKQEEEEKMDVDDSQDSNQECGIAYEPIHLLRCHSVDNDPTDWKTNVWKCSFEPNVDVEGASKWTVATCGSNQVCVIDCNSGLVLKKYQHTKEKEEFYCIAWTKLGIITETRRKPTTILAAAGIKGSIKLLHTTQLLCYSEIKFSGRARPINCLLFHPKKPNWLFCGAEDITVVDIGIPHGADLKCRHKKLFVLDAPGRCLGLVIDPKSNFLMAGCDNGCYGWTLDANSQALKKDKEHTVEFLLPSKARLLGDEEEAMDEDGEKEGDMIDGLALIKDDLIASKVACDGSIHVWSLSHSRKQQKEGSKEVTINPLYTLEWCDSDSVYLDIGTWPGCGVLVSGDDQGEVWVYDVSKKSRSKSKKPVKPSQLLPWPENNEQDMSDAKEEAEGSKKEGEEEKTENEATQATENKDNAENAEVIAVVQSSAGMEGEAIAESAESAVANVLEEVVSKVVGEETKEGERVSEDSQQASTAGQVNGEKDEGKEGEREVEKQEVTQQGEKEQGKDGEVEKEGEGEQKKAEAEGEKKEKEEGKEEEEEKEKEEEEKEKEEEEKEKDEEEKEEEKEEKDDNAESKTPVKRRGRPPKETPVESVEPEKRRGRPKKPKSAEEEKKLEEKAKVKADLLAQGIVRGRGRPRKEVPTVTPDASSSAAQTAKARREVKVQEAAKVKSEKAEKAAQLKAEKAEKKAQAQAAAAKAKEEKAKEKEERARLKAEKAAERAKEKAELAELRQSLKKPKKGGNDVMDIANTEDRIIVNDVAISSDCKFIVSVTNKNLICIWQRV